MSPPESDSDDEGKHGESSPLFALCELQRFSAMTLASSIHTIHRPVARSRRGQLLDNTFAVDDTPRDETDSSTGQDQLQRSMMSDEDTDADDFELPRSLAASRRVGSRKDRQIGLSPVLEHASPKFAMRHHIERSGSMSTFQTVKPSRRARLAEKLAEVFEIAGINEVIAGGYYIYFTSKTFLTAISSEMPCWLMRSVCEYPRDQFMQG